MMNRLGIAIVSFSLFVLTAACSNVAETAPTRRSSASPSSDGATAGGGGPLDGETWPGSVPVNALLHDDGRRLWAYELSGERSLVWRHPRAEVLHIAASPDGEELALSALLPNRRPRDPSAVLYYLRSSGQVETVDVVKNYTTLETPTFLRPPTQFRKHPLLYWVRLGQDVDEFGRLESQLMVLSEGEAQEVRVPLRFAEAAFQVNGYPGAALSSVSLFRKNDVPTRLDVVVTRDFAQSTKSSLTLWGNIEHRADTDILLGVAWLTPTDYVIPVMNSYHPRGFALRLFRVNCEKHGSYDLYRGTRIDTGYAETPWRIMGAGSSKVLVLGAKALKRVFLDKAKTAPWLKVSVPGGEISRTGVNWEPGPWTWVSRDQFTNPRKATRCKDFKWTWP